MKEKRGDLLSLMLFLIALSIILSIPDAEAIGCCISQANGCEDAKILPECDSILGTFFDNQLCANIPGDNCYIGCCCESGTSKNNIFKKQCRGEFFTGTFTNTECNSQCSTTTPETEPITNETLPVSNQTIVPPTIIQEPFNYINYCGDNKVDFYEECDGTMDTRAEGALSDCQNQCAPVGSSRPCTCPVSCGQDPSPPLLLDALPITGSKEVALEWTFPPTSCQSNYAFVQRCEGRCDESGNWQQISDSLFENSFTDTTFKYDTEYSYRIGAYYSKEQTLAVNKYSNIITIGAISELCVKLDGSNVNLCYDNSETICSPLNQLEKIFDCGQIEGVCVGGKCFTDTSCDVCLKPFGIFISPACASAACYKDFSRFNVDTYGTCKNINSCYDYRSQDACNSNTCGIDQPGNCQWSNTKSYELGMGVCKPSNEIYQDCGKCSSPNNRILGGCDREVCGLVGDNCIFTNYDTCVSEEENACIYYTSESQCEGTSSQSVDVDVIYDETNSRIGGTNKITQLSQDLSDIGRCKWQGQCIKDADGNDYRDCNERDFKCQKDIIPPITITQQMAVVPRNINLPFTAFDNSYSVSGIQTYYAIEKNWTYPTSLATNSRFSRTIGESGFYILTYYSKDGANNLEEVKSMRFFVDGILPSVNVSYDYTAEQIGIDKWSSKVNIMLTTSDNADQLITCSGQLKMINGTIITATDSMQNELISQRAIHYSDIKDGRYIFSYSCSDRSSNQVSGNLQLNIAGDQSLTNPSPNTALNHHDDIIISITSQKDAICKFSENYNIYENMEGIFSSSNKRYHSASVSVNPLVSHHRFYVKCKQEIDNSIIGGTDDEIRFTIDEKPPITKIEGANQNCLANWQHNNVYLNFDCQDPPQQKQGFPGQFNCSYTKYCLGQGCSPNIAADSVSITYTSPVAYYSADNGNNQEQIKRDTIRIDKIPAYASIQLLDASSNPPAPLTISTISRSTPEPYIVRIRTNKAIDRIYSFTFSVGTEFYDLPKPYPINAEKTEWQTFLIPSKFTNLLSQAEFRINAMAEHNWPITELSNKNFYINTVPQTGIAAPASSIGTITINSILSGNASVNAISEIKDGRNVYHLQEQNIIIKGSVSNINANATSPLSYYIGTEAGQQITDIQLINGQFELPIELLTINGAEIETFVYFLGTDTQGVKFSKAVSFIIDRQAPQPVNYELREAPDGLMIKSPLPSIVVDFDEAINLTEYGITGFDNRIEVTNLDNRQYIFNVKDPLTNGCYKLYVRAKDIAGNVAENAYEVAFGVDASDTKIILQTPHHGVSQTKDYEMLVKTTWAATCKYGFANPNNDFDFPLLLNFDKTGTSEAGALEHTKKGFSTEKDQSFYVICDDGRQVMQQAFVLKLDSANPEITSAKAEPNVLNQQPLQTKLMVETNEGFTICKYSKTTNDYSFMRYFPLESYDDPNTYKKIHMLPLSFTDNTPRSESYYVQCEDLSGRKTALTTITYEIKEQALYMTVSSPPRYTKERFIDLNFTTNKDADCGYKNVSGKMVEISKNSRIHSINLGRYNIGTFTINLDCTSLVGLQGTLSKPELAELAYTFTIDGTVPVLSSVNAGNQSCKTDDGFEMGITFNAFDNESGIASYRYSIVGDKGAEISTNQTTTTRQVTVNSLNLEMGSKYKVIATAYNGAGMESTTKESALIIAKNSTSIECREKRAPTISLLVANSGGGVLVAINCNDESGCDAGSFKYGTSTTDKCSATSSYSQEVELSESTYFCGTACDSLNNCGTAQQKIEVLIGDSDGDGVFDNTDECPGTLEGEQVDEKGCSDSQRDTDSDSDGILDQFDMCPNTPLDQPIDETGCPTTLARPDIEIAEPQTSLLSWILMTIIITGILGTGGYFAYMQYFVPETPITPERYQSENVQRPTPKRMILAPIKRPSLDQWSGIKAGEDVFKALEHATRGRVFDKITSLFKKQDELDVFSKMEKATRFKPKTPGMSSKDVFDQMTRLTSLRKSIKPERPLEDLKKIAREKSKRTKK